LRSRKGLLKNLTTLDQGFTDKGIQIRKSIA
jgi:hypothetical protein